MSYWMVPILLSGSANPELPGWPGFPNYDFVKSSLDPKLFLNPNCPLTVKGLSS